MYDLIVRGGTLVDGTGAPARQADVAIEDERIVAVGSDLGEARRVIDASGLLVTPGWVDIHTHYDGQVTWDLPGNGNRLVQEIDGYRYTVKSGEVTYEEGKPTGAMPGKLVRGPQLAPNA